MVVFPIPAANITVLSPSQPIPSRHLSSLHHSLSRTRTTATTLNKQFLVLPQTQTTTSYLSQERPPRYIELNLRSVGVRSQLRYPIISPDDHWGVWSTIFGIGAFGLCEDQKQIFSPPLWKMCVFLEGVVSFIALTLLAEDVFDVRQCRVDNDTDSDTDTSITCIFQTKTSIYVFVFVFVFVFVSMSCMVLVSVLVFIVISLFVS